VESSAIGLAAGLLTAAETLGSNLEPFPATTALGALINHITGGHIETIDNGPPSFQPMNINFGLFPPIAFDAVDANGKKLRGPDKGAERKRALTARAAADLDQWVLKNPI
jgi:methylenetetrahydrofolate--tRNA-(uracil-5-)-methyltransferase